MESDPKLAKRKALEGNLTYLNRTRRLAEENEEDFAAFGDLLPQREGAGDDGAGGADDDLD